MDALSHRGYDAGVPNKTIYVSDGYLPLFQRAQELAGGNLSSAIASALRRFVDLEDSKLEGFKEIVVQVGPGKGRKVRFAGVMLAEWAVSTSSRYELYRVYGSRTGKFVLHVDRSAEWTMVDGDGKPAGWRGYLGIGNLSYGARPAASSIAVYDTLDDLRDKVPAPLFDMLSGTPDGAGVEDLDI